MLYLRRALAVGFFAFFSFHAVAGILINVPQTLSQPDGSSIQCFASGDEFHHWLHDARDFTIVQDPADGWFVYARLENAELVPTSLRVGRDDPAAGGLVPGINLKPEAMESKRAHMLERTGTTASAATVGTLNNIVIFIRFADETPSSFPDLISTYENMFNSGATNANTLYNYYQQVSYNTLSVHTTFYPATSDSVLSYVDSHPRNYYRKYNAVTNPIGYIGDSWGREQTMLAAAVRAVSSQVPAGLNIDANNDGYVDNVCFILSGGAEGWADLLWPHMTSLTIDQVPVNGKVVGVYNLQLRNYLLDPGSQVSVLAHEMFHSLGSPDLYHYSGASPDPIGPWDLMCYSPNPPVHMSAYMKWRYGGWIPSIPTITKPGTYSLTPLVFGGRNCYKIPSIYSTHEYFVLEYRKRVGAFEKSIPDQGLLVYRVNTDLGGNADGPPDELYLYRLAGTRTLTGWTSAAAMSANNGYTTLNDTTMPSCFLTDGSPGGLRLYGVGAVGDSILFSIDFPQIPVISLSSRAIYYDPIDDRRSVIDTTVIVRNTGYGIDTLSVTVNRGGLKADSALTASPASFILAPGDSQAVSIRMRPWLIDVGYYSAFVTIGSRQSLGTKNFPVLLDFEKTTSGVEGPADVPLASALEQNYPNPFNPATTIRFRVGFDAPPDAGNVTVTIHDLLGREVAVLVNEQKSPGRYSVEWNASGMASGVYYCRMVAGTFVQVRPLVLLR
jgi:M6 family metalloprotease-like protein